MVKFETQFAKESWVAPTFEDINLQIKKAISAETRARKSETAAIVEDQEFSKTHINDLSKRLADLESELPATNQQFHNLQR